MTGYAIDTHRPTLAVSARQSIGDNLLGINEASVVSIQFSEAVSGLIAKGITLPDGAGTLSNPSPVNPSDDYSDTWTFPLTAPGSGNAISVSLGGVSNRAGNATRARARRSTPVCATAWTSSGPRSPPPAS